MSRDDFRLNRDPFGRLMLRIGNRIYDSIVPVRSFPISAPDEGIALVGMDGDELIWINTLADLSDDMRRLVEEELASREFVPEIRHILQVSSFATPSRWQIETDRGKTIMVLKAEEDIRRLSATRLLIADDNGVQYLIRDTTALDKTSRRLLDRFL